MHIIHKLVTIDTSTLPPSELNLQEYFQQQPVSRTKSLQPAMDLDHIHRPQHILETEQYITRSLLKAYKNS